MFKEATHNSATFTLPFQESWASISSLKSEIYQKKKKKNVSKHSSIIKTKHTLHHLHNYLSKSPERQFQVSKSKIYKKKEKER